MFLVKWQDLSEKVVYRRFTEIYEFHVSVGWAGVTDPPAVLGNLGTQVPGPQFGVPYLTFKKC